MGLGTSTIKYILFFINFLFALSGLALLGLGLVTRYYSTKSEELANKASGDAVGLAALAFIIIGGAVFVVSFFGCCGAIRESHCMITIYAMFLLALFLLEAAIGVFLYVNRGQVEPITEKLLTTVFKDYSNDSDSRAFVDKIQHEFHCCGIDGPNYWTDQTAAAIPHSCCKEDNGQGTTCLKTQAWQDGCPKKSVEFVKSKLGKLLNIIIAIAGGELIGIIFALCLASSIKNEERRQGYA
ncbi:Tetraspanin/Peripherin,Tetraspanin,Tetraspanin, EC2 domain,Tetraspanin, conserved site [Cinara cedri]|uniref:Tetraspanin n=1 Tax=Cinara cedri TaxID=506608 RepID=A0A5E4N174_9HEMI|nr:Tetraspanin/Peripherin,Tetraspanin,Tetraspanin, EC2 domain,Tetraspanin, conserved site [Cinara cedri]